MRSRQKIGPKTYLPTKPQIDPSYHSPVPNPDIPIPAQQYLPPHSDYIAPANGIYVDAPPTNYLPPQYAFKPPKKDKKKEQDVEDLPEPPAPEDLPSPDDAEIFEFPGRTNAGKAADENEIKPSLLSRGPQSPVSEEQKKKKPQYSDPPKRSEPVSAKLVAPSVVNSQAMPSKDSQEYYIPPRTSNEVPKGYKKPDDDLPTPEEIDEDIETFSEGNGLQREPFLGLAKFIRPTSATATSTKGLPKFEKLVQLNDNPSLPPIPTLPPQPETFLPLVESLSPSLLQQLRSGFLNQVRSQTKLTGGGKGHIPGKPGVDYPDFKTIPNTEFSCENFILEGFLR